MDIKEYEELKLHLDDMQPQTPLWCKAEKMELSISQRVLWRIMHNVTR